MSCREDIIFGGHLKQIIGPCYFVRALGWKWHKEPLWTLAGGQKKVNMLTGELQMKALFPVQTNPILSFFVPNLSLKVVQSQNLFLKYLKSLSSTKHTKEQCCIIFNWLILHYFLQLMLVGLAWKSTAKGNEKLVHQNCSIFF